jgi:drug/metabolite transporter (DMT)-like permease
MPVTPQSLQKYLGYFQIIIAAMLWSTYVLFIRVLPYSPETIVFFRFYFGLFGLLIYSLISKNYSWVKPAQLYWKSLVIAGVLCCFSWLAYTYSLSLTSVANTVFLIYTAPLFVVILTPIVLKEKIENKSIIGLFLSLLGTISIMGYSSLFATGSMWLGDLIALGGGLAYGLFVLYLKRLPIELLGLSSNITISGLIALVIFPFAISSFNQLSWTGIFILLIMGVFLQAIAVTFYHLGLRTVKAQHAGILSYAEPLCATIFAILLLHEKLTIGSFLGGVLIITSGVIIITDRGNKPAKEILIMGRDKI